MRLTESVAVEEIHDEHVFLILHATLSFPAQKRPNVAGKDTEKVSKDNQKSLYIFQSLNLEKNKTEDIQYPDIQPLFPRTFSAPLIIPHFSQYQNLKACSNI